MLIGAIRLMLLLIYDGWLFILKLIKSYILILWIQKLAQEISQIMPGNKNVITIFQFFIYL